MARYNVGVGRELYSTLHSPQNQTSTHQLGEGCSKCLLSRLATGCNKILHLLTGLQAEQAGLCLTHPTSYYMLFLVQPQEYFSLIQSRFNPGSLPPPPLLGFISVAVSHSASAFVRPVSCEDFSLLHLVVCFLLQPSCGEERT